MASHRIQQWATFARQWWIFDARHQCPFKSASAVIPYLEGKHKPIYHPLSQCGDCVVVFNTKHVAMRDEMWRTWKYFHHTGYPGGFSETRAWKYHEKDYTAVFRDAVYKRVKGNLLRKPTMARLYLYPEEDIPPHILRNVTGQIRQVMPIPKRLDEYTDEERVAFPALFDWPEDYIKEVEDDVEVEQRPVEPAWKVKQTLKKRAKEIHWVDAKPVKIR